MKSHYTTTLFHLEQLEQRRLLCGDLGAHGALMEGDQTASPAVTDESVAGGAESAGGVVSALGRSQAGARVVWGEATVIDGARVVTWALVSPQDNEILAAGITMPLKLIDNQPQQGGSGPAGAIASLEFPAIVQETTFFNHLELHTQPNGHPFLPFAANPNRYRAPHFDFHFYSIPEEQVRAIPFVPLPLPAVPANRLPAGYRQPGPSELEMGRHSGPLSEATATDPWRAVMITGFKPDGSQMHFVEPMITRATLLERQDFSLPMPMPSEFGRQTLYPTSFEAVFQGNAYHLVFSDFVHTDAPTTATAATTAVRPGGPDPLVVTPSSRASISFTTQSEDDTEDRAVTEILA